MKRLYFACVALAVSLNVYCDPIPLNPAEIDAANRNLISTSQSDNVDPYNGVLSINQQDVLIKGPAGLDIVVNRNYSTAELNPVTGMEDFARVVSNNDKWIGLGYGWTVNVAPQIFIPGNAANSEARADYAINKLCQKNPWRPAIGSYEYYVIDVDGKSKKLFPAEAGVANSLDNWRFSCEGVGGTLLLQDPKGIKYQLTKVNQINPSSGGISSNGANSPIAVLIQAEKAYDNHGNWLKFEYSGFQISSVTSSEGALVRFQYANNSSGISQLRSIETPNGVWRYSYDSTKIPNFLADYGYLAKVQRPDGQEYKFTYWDESTHSQNYFTECNPANDDAARTVKLKSMQIPTGGIIEYDYDFGYQYGAYTWPWVYIPIESWHCQPNVQEAKVVKRSMVGVGEWRYSYNPAKQVALEQLDTTTVTSPTETTVYKHIGINYFWRPEITRSQNVTGAWKVGLLIEKTIGDKYSEKYEWGSILHNSNWFYSVTGENAIGIYDNPARLPILNKKTIISNGAVYVTDFLYDSYGRPTRAQEQGSSSRTTTYTYDDVLTKKSIFNAITNQTVTSPGLQSTFTTRSFDQNTGKVLTENVDSVVTQYTWSASGDLASKTDANMHTTYYNNYKRGVAQQEVRAVAIGQNIVVNRVVDDAGNIRAETNGRGLTTNYVYDALNRVTGIYPPVNNPTITVWGKDTRVETKGNSSTITYMDGFARPIKSSINGVVTNRRFDASNRLVFESYPGSALGETMEYDVLGRLVKQMHGDNTWIRWDHEPAGTHRIDETNERGFVTQRQYQSFGSPSDKQLLAISKLNAPAANVSITRNLRDQVTSVTQNGRTRNYNYDNRFYLISRVDPETGVTTYSRDNVGNMLSSRVSTNGETRYVYDWHNRLLDTIYPNSLVAHFDYDNTNNLLKSTYGSASHSYTYDANSNLETETISNGDKIFTTKYTYNGNNARQTLIYPNGRIIDFSPDAFGRPTRIGDVVPAIWYHPNGAVYSMVYGNGTGVTQYLNSRQWLERIQIGKGGTGGCSPTIAPAPSNSPVIESQPDGSYALIGNPSSPQKKKLSFTFIPFDDFLIPIPKLPDDALTEAMLSAATGRWFGGNSIRDATGRVNPVPCTIGGAGSKLYADQSYGYDGTGNIKNIRDSVRPTANRDLDYDAIDRLTIANGNWGAGSIVYDGNSNITRQTYGNYNLAYSYDSATQKLLNTTGAVAGSYQYDTYGNVISRGTGQTYSYDEAGNLAFINKGLANQFSYTYDAKGWRVRSKSSTVDLQQVYIGNNLVTEYDAIAKGWVDHLYLGNQKVADWTWGLDASQKREYFYADPAGSPMLATDEQGNVLWSANYYPYGYKLAGGMAGERNKQWFGGKAQDDESGLQYFGARYYDPIIGRFMAVDPVDWQESNPFHSFNSYAYANNNPFRFVDPDGQVPLDTIWDVGNVIYDLGKIAVGAVTGNSAMVASGSVDLAADLAATAMPYVPAGASKVVGGLKKVPNPFGKAGGPQHQAKVKEIMTDIKSRGLEPDTELFVKTPNGNKSRRFVDVIARDKGQVVEMHQVGRQTKSGNPVSRETKALDDIQRATNVRPQYHPYN